jgi:Lon protease-like protein
VTSIAMMCPFAPNEKQALLEAKTLDERAHLLTALIEMSLSGPTPDPENGVTRH